MTIGDLAQEALNVQDACNLTGVVHGFSRALAKLRELEPDKPTEWYNTHSICLLWADKIAQLTGTQTLGQSSVLAAYDKVYELAELRTQHHNV